MYANCLPGARVEVHVNNERLAEHATENDVGSATTFVEAVAGASFAVVLHLEPAFAYRIPQDRLSFALYLDGECARTLIVNPNVHDSEVLDCAVQTVGKNTTRRKFLFAEHETSTPIVIAKFDYGL